MNELELVKEIATNASSLMLLAVMAWTFGLWLRQEITAQREFQQRVVEKLLDKEK